MMLRVPRGAGAGCRQRQRLAEAESGGVVSELVLVVLLEHSRHKGHLHCPCFRSSIRQVRSDFNAVQTTSCLLLSTPLLK